MERTMMRIDLSDDLKEDLPKPELKPLLDRVREVYQENMIKERTAKEMAKKKRKLYLLVASASIFFMATVFILRYKGLLNI